MASRDGMDQVAELLVEAVFVGLGNGKSNLYVSGFERGVRAAAIAMGLGNDRVRALYRRVEEWTRDVCPNGGGLCESGVCKLCVGVGERLVKEWLAEVSDGKASGDV